MYDNDYYRKYADLHICYEINMLKETVLICSRSIQGASTTTWVLKNASLESFCIHMRNLLDFLYPNIIRKDDVTIFNFLSIDEVNRYIPKITKYLSKYRIKAHKEIAHLTCDRKANTKAKSWPYHLIAIKILTIYSILIKKISSEKIGVKFRNTIAEANKAINPPNIIIHPVSNTSNI